MIPKILHQVWVGPNPPPTRAMETWRRRHPDWEYRIWTDHTGWENQKAIDAMPEWNGKADIMRYEILYRHGGVVVDADSECLRSLDDHFLEHIAWACWENETCRCGVLACGAMGGIPGAPIWYRCIREIGFRDMKRAAWAEVGPGLLSEIARGDRSLHLYPARMFIPWHYSGVRAPGNDEVYGRQLWGTTRGYQSMAVQDRSLRVVSTGCSADWVPGCIWSVSVRGFLPCVCMSAA